MKRERDGAGSGAGEANAKPPSGGGTVHALLPQPKPASDKKR